MEICEAIVKITGVQCIYKAKLKNKEGLHVCRPHKNYVSAETLEFLKNQKIKEIIEENNQKLLSENPGKIPLRNIEGKIHQWVLVDPEDYDRVNQHKWSAKIMSKTLIYALGHIDDMRMRMHHFILKKPEDNQVIHHKDHNGLNNMKANLEFASINQNAQHKPKKKDVSSKYIGVLKNKNDTFRCNAGGHYLGNFKDEIEAAKKYDTFVLLKYGPEAMTNELVKYEDIKDVDIETLLRKRDRDLPLHITLLKDKFIVQILYKGQKYISRLNTTLEGAIKKLDEFNTIINELKAKDREDHFNKPILRNEKNQAILLITNCKKEIVEKVVVDDDKWHDLAQYSWSKSGDYYQATINKKQCLLHRYLADAKKGELIDHVNEDEIDKTTNTLKNLRINTPSGNSHNRKKSENTSSKYFGVSLNKQMNKWLAQIYKDRKHYSLGLFEHDIDAAKAYNEKAIELYGDKARLNIL